MNSMEKKEASIVLFEKIDQLPDKQKKAILLHKFEGYSHKEICEKMSLSQASVESLIYRAKVSLRKLLVSYFENYNQFQLGMNYLFEKKIEIQRKDLKEVHLYNHR
mgnify:CR=1 FL=1